MKQGTETGSGTMAKQQEWTDGSEHQPEFFNRRILGIDVRCSCGKLYKNGFSTYAAAEEAWDGHELLARNFGSHVKNRVRRPDGTLTGRISFSV
jgi:hypothetical protein